MAYQFTNNLNEGVNLDLALIRMPANAAIFIKNLTQNINTNSNAAGESGQNEKIISPLEGNQALSLSGMPSGTNYCVGFFSSEQTNEGYFAVWNSSNNHTVWVISGEDGTVRKVHESSLLPFLLDPAFFYSEGRMTLELISDIDPLSGLESNFKLLVFTNNNVLQCLLDVEASIATNSYTTTYFTASAAFYNPLELIHLGSVLPIKCVKLNDPTAYSPVPDDANRQNLLINSGWQFRIRTWDVWGRPSDWGIISSVYTSLVGGGCISTSNGLPRCVNLCFDAGSPLIKFITVAFRRGVGNDPSGQTETGWEETETFRKYDDFAGVEWYNRPYNPVFTTSGSGITFNAGTNIITYTFCADKGSNPVDPTEAAYTQPGLPRMSSGVASVNKALALSNNAYDFEPIAQAVVDAVDFSVLLPNPTVPGQVPCPAAPLRTIVLYANIYNAYGDFASEPLIKRSYGIVTFGSDAATIPPNTPDCHESAFSLDQVFGDQTNPGFIAYLAGTPFKVIGEWGDYDPVADIFTANPTFLGTGMPHIKMIRFTFVDVPAGRYVVRLASHHATINDGNLQKTSTQVWATCPIGYAQIAFARRIAGFSTPNKEIVVDCSTGNVNLGGLTGTMFVILDLGDGLYSNGIDGYLKEYEGGAPVEMAVVFFHGAMMGTPSNSYGSWFTDHNGYFFMTGSGSGGGAYSGVDLIVNLCTPNVNQVVFSQTSGCGGSTGKMAHGNGLGAGDYWGNFGAWYNEVYVAHAGGVVTTFPAEGRRVIKQKFTVCGQQNIGVPGIPVVMARCQPALTDSSGLATLIAHNRYDYLSVVSPSMASFGADLLPNGAIFPFNADYLTFSQKGGCEWNVCRSCDTAMADVLVDYIDCAGGSVGCTGSQPPRTTCLATLSVQPNGVGIYGVQSGGKYPVAFWVHDLIGRHTSPQIKPGELGYVYIPNLNDTTPTPYPAMALCSLQFTIPRGLFVGLEFTHFTPLVGLNALFSDYISWNADYIQYVDNTGVTNTANPTSIRIYWQSLNEYNKQYNEQTNTAWDFITKSPGQVNDIVQFIMNGDGKFLPSIKGAAVTYNQAGMFFTIDYQPELSGLINGCLFKIIRPKQNNTNVNLPYYEQCLTLDIVNGFLPSGTWTIPYRDSYLLSRSVPVPQLQGQPGPTPPGTTPPNPIEYTSSNLNTDVVKIGYAENNPNINSVMAMAFIDAQTTFPFFFESPSPSDLSQSHLGTPGRVGIPNPYEEQFRVGTEIAVSNPVADKGIVNGIGTYLDANKQAFDRNTYGDITVSLVQQGVLMVICKNDYFITRYNQTQFRVVDGTVLAQNPGDGIFTAPETKIGSNYGVIPANINTIVCFNGMVVFLDNKGHLIFSNFSNAKPVEKDGYQAYLLQKIADVNNQNLLGNGKTYFQGQFDVKTMEYYLTNFNIPDISPATYINTQDQPTLGINETMIFDLEKGTLKGFASFTPEYYGRIPGYYTQRQFLSFKHGVPYIHHNNLAGPFATPPYINFYGVQEIPIITHVINQADKGLLPDKVKRFLYNELYVRASIPEGSGVMPSALFYSDSIISEKGQQSRLLVGRWDLKDGYQCAAFLCDLTTPPDPNQIPQTTTHAILDGNPLQGRYCVVRYKGQVVYSGTYFELTSVVSYFNLLEKSAD